MAIITLTTDLGLKDYYVGTLKGAILSQSPDAIIIDLSHEIKPFDMLQASIIVRNTYRDFPKGTIHIIGVNPEVTLETRHLVVFIHEQYFVIPDNGIFSLIFDSRADDIIELNLTRQEELITFPSKDLYVRAACHLARGGSLQVLGKSVDDIRERALFRAVSEERLIRGMAVYVDHYGNVITNIEKTLFRQYQKFPEFAIQLRRSEYEIREISKAYSDVPVGEKLALFSSGGYLEIAINQGSASKLMGIQQNDIIRIEFHDHPDR